MVRSVMETMLPVSWVVMVPVSSVGMFLHDIDIVWNTWAICFGVWLAVTLLWLCHALFLRLSGKGLW